MAGLSACSGTANGDWQNTDSASGRGASHLVVSLDLAVLRR